MKTSKTKSSKEHEEILLELSHITEELKIAQNRLDNITNDILIDSIIFEIKALHKRYEYYLQLSKELGMVSNNFTKIS